MFEYVLSSQKLRLRCGLQRRSMGRYGVEGGVWILGMEDHKWVNIFLLKVSSHPHVTRISYHKSRWLQSKPIPLLSLPYSSVSIPLSTMRWSRIETPAEVEKMPVTFLDFPDSRTVSQNKPLFLINYPVLDIVLHQWKMNQSFFYLSCFKMLKVYSYPLEFVQIWVISPLQEKKNHLKITLMCNLSFTIFPSSPQKNVISLNYFFSIDC